MSTLRVDNIKSRTGSIVTIPENNTLAVTGITSVSGNLNVSGNANVTGALNVTGSGTVNTSGIMTVGSLNVSNQTTFSQGVQVGGALTVTGNFTVNGTTTTIDTVNLSIKDNTIDLRSGNSITAGTGGIRVIQTTDGSGNVTSSREIRYNHSTGKWEFSENGTTYKNMGSGGIAFSYFCGSF